MLSKPIADGLRELNISAFITKNKVEFLFHDAWLVLHMAPKRAEKLNQWLVSRGWPNYSVVCPEECPAFYIQKTDHDQIIVLNSLIEWNSYSQVDKEQIIQKYKKLGFKFYEKARNIKMRECKTKISLNPGDFKVVELPLKSTKHYLL